MTERKREREREREGCAELLMIVKTDILSVLEFFGNYFLNTCNCFKAALPFVVAHGERL
jgi:hypothetical protein